jgi:TM2 domain-containing membrane protein YozV
MMEEYEQPTLWSGCLGPVVRNFVITGLNFTLAVIVGLAMDSFWWFIGSMAALTVIYDLIARRLWKRRDDVLRRRFWGIERGS